MTLLAFIAPETARNILLIVAGIAYLTYHIVRWMREERGQEKVKGEEKVKVRGEGEQGKVKVKGEGEQGKVKVRGEGEEKVKGEGEQRKVNRKGQGQERTNLKPETLNLKPGADIFRRARAMRHRRIPDYRTDGLYLDQLGDAVALGYAPAMAKLGEYAMRRRTWVEAYYWMSLAKRHGMPNCDAALRDIRRQWMMAGYPDETWNVYELFSEKSGAIGLALLNVATGRDVYAAKRFLAEHLPPVRQ